MKSKAASSETRQYQQTTRAQSAEATAQRIVDAFIERLMAQWFDEITLDRIAEDAGVTVQTIVRRFGGKEGLLAIAARKMGAEINARRAAPAGDIHRLITNLVDDYELTGDTVARLLALEQRHPALKTLLDFGRAEHRRWVTSAFAVSFDKLDSAARQRAIDALVVVTDNYTWKLIRRDMARSAAATVAIMKTLVAGAITEISNSIQKEKSHAI